MRDRVFKIKAVIRFFDNDSRDLKIVQDIIKSFPPNIILDRVPCNVVIVNKFLLNQLTGLVHYKTKTILTLKRLLPYANIEIDEYFFSLKCIGYNLKI